MNHLLLWIDDSSIKKQRISEIVFKDYGCGLTIHPIKKQQKLIN